MEIIQIFTNISMLLLAIGMACFAYKQHVLQKYFYKLQAYPERIKIYDQMKSFSSKVVMTGNTDYREGIELLHKTRHSKFLFNQNDNIEKYIKKFYKNALELEYCNKALNSSKCNDEERKKLIKKNEKLFHWFVDQSCEIDKLFEEFLCL